jgi:predicted house-cleaning noncanonical NTP pyrophosphatase (MazG superfamily)
MAQYEKLVRDKIPEILNGKGVSYEKRIANDTEYRTELIKKLVEESHEFAEAGLPEELADVLEVIVALRTLSEYADVEQIREQKKEDRGGFKERFILKGDDGR